jgi:hypothetical protein
MATIEVREYRRLKRDLKRLTKIAGNNASLWAKESRARQQADALVVSLGREVNEWRARFDALIVRLPKLEA